MLKNKNKIKLQESFDIMHFTEREKMNLFTVVAGIMHMGEIKFKQRPREEQAECEDQAGTYAILR